VRQTAIAGLLGFLLCFIGILLIFVMFNATETEAHWLYPVLWVLAPPAMFITFAVPDWLILVLPVINAVIYIVIFLIVRRVSGLMGSQCGRGKPRPYSTKVSATKGS
jgi:hypothetical protein